MTRFFLIACALAFSNSAFGQEKSFLETSKIWKVELRVGAEDWKAMQPKGGGPPGFGGPRRRAFRLCQDCAATCEKSGTAHGKSCAKACRACAAACLEARK